jgi:hypothetical protein
VRQRVRRACIQAEVVGTGGCASSTAEQSRTRAAQRRLSAFVGYQARRRRRCWSRGRSASGSRRTPTVVVNHDCADRRRRCAAIVCRRQGDDHRQALAHGLRLVDCRLASTVIARRRAALVAAATGAAAQVVDARPRRDRASRGSHFRSPSPR